MSTHAQPSRTERIAAEAHHRAQALDRSYPPLQELQAIADPRARRLVISHRATLTALAAPEISPAAIEGLLLDANDALNTYNAIESEDGDDGGGGGDASDCMAGCDRNLKDCIESWSEIVLETDVDLFDGEAEDQANDSGGAVGSIDDNPVDVEQSDAGDTGAEQEDDPRSDDWFDQLSTVQTAMMGGLCSLTYSLCIAACLLQAGIGSVATASRSPREGRRQLP